jgi:hypothetical protein
MKDILINFLNHICDECTDEYGNMQVIKTEDEEMKKMYYSYTPEGIVEEYMKNNNLK